MRQRFSRLGVFLGICWLYACIHLDRQILGVLAESLKSDLQLSDQQLGVLTGSSFSFVFAMLGLFFGNFSDRADRLVLVRIGAWVWSLSCMGAALAGDYPLLIVSRGGVAVGEAVATAAAVSLIAELAGEDHRGLAAGVFFTSAFVGAGLAAIGGGALLSLFRHSSAIVGWRAVMIAAGLPGIVGAFYLTLLYRRETPVKLRSDRPRARTVVVIPALASAGAIALQMALPPVLSLALCLALACGVAGWWARRLLRLDPQAVAATLGQRSFRYVVLAFSAVMFVDYAAAFWFIPYAQRRFGLDAATVGAELGSLLLVGGIIGCLLGGLCADQWRRYRVAGRVWTALVAVVAESLSILIALGQSDQRGFLVAFAAFCLASGGWVGVAAAISFDLVPRQHRGTGTSIYFLVTTLLGPGLGPFAVGFGSDLTGSVATSLGCACAVMVLAAAALIALGLSLRPSAVVASAPRA